MSENGDIEIYMQKIEKFFETSEVNYFYKPSEKDLFITKVKEVAIKNLEEKGSLELTREQMEEVRIEVRNNPIMKDSTIHYNHVGLIYLN